MWEDNDLVFSTQQGRFLLQRNTRRSFYRMLKVAELPHMRVYDLRHSAASLLLHWGVDIKTISGMLGHSKSQITMDQYAHLMDDAQKVAATKMEQLGTA